MARKKSKSAAKQIKEALGEKEVPEKKEADQPQEWECVEPCYHQSKKYRLGESITAVGRPNKNFKLKGGVSPPSKKAASALPQDQQGRIHDLITLCGLDLVEELEKMGISSLAVFPPLDAQVYIEKLQEKYEERKRKGSDMGPDERAGKDEAGEDV